MASRKPRGILIAGNWKMNGASQDTEDFFTELKKHSTREMNTAGLTTVLVPPFLSLAKARQLAAKNSFPLEIAAQNAHWEKRGAFTGEVSGPMLQELEISWVLIGHSERRQLFGETNDTAARRMQSLLEQGFRVIFCVGETRAQRESGKTEDILTDQIQSALRRGESAAGFLDGRLVLAYEPIWAIGSGLTASPEQAEEAHQFIRKLLWDRFGLEAAGLTPILYGGSVTPENVDSLLSCPNVDGALVGGASLRAEQFSKLVLAGAKAL